MIDFDDDKRRKGKNLKENISNKKIMLEKLDKIVYEFVIILYIDKFFCL